MPAIGQADGSPPGRPTRRRALGLKAKHRCRMHGSAKGSGAQPGNANARKHGF